MRKPLQQAYRRCLADHIKLLREKAGMTQRDLAKALGREHGMVARIELSERRLDLGECYELFKVLGVDPIKELPKVLRKFAALDAEIESESGS